MKAVWKYELESPGTVSEFDLPECSRVLHVGEQYSKLVMWVEVDTSSTIVCRRVFHVVGTGWEGIIADDTAYVGTIQAFNGLVWHVYEKLG